VVKNNKLSTRQPAIRGSPAAALLSGTPISWLVFQQRRRCSIEPITPRH